MRRALAALLLAASLHAQSLDQILTTFVKPPKATRPAAPATITSDARMEELKAATVAELRAPNAAMLMRAVNKLIAAGITNIVATDLPPAVSDHLDRLCALAKLGHPVYRYAVLGPQPGFPAIPTRDFAYISSPTQGRQFEKVILSGTPPPDNAPTRWRIGKYEFLFYYNETFKDKEFTLPAEDLEEWDLASGNIRPVTDRTLVLEIGAAQLYRRLALIPASTQTK